MRFITFPAAEQAAFAAGMGLSPLLEFRRMMVLRILAIEESKRMTFKADHKEHSGPYNGPAGARCFNCNKPLEGASVSYDGYAANGVTAGLTIYMHTHCASAVAQRLICDAWPNRHAGEYIKVP